MIGHITLPQQCYQELRELLLWMDAKPEFVEVQITQYMAWTELMAEYMEQSPMYAELRKYAFSLSVHDNQVLATLRQGETKIGVYLEAAD